MIISVDPGITNCGIAIQKRVGANVEVIITRNVSGGRKIVNENEVWLKETYDERTAKIQRICREMEEMMEDYPDIEHIVLEAPFFNRFSPVSFAALLSILEAIKYTIAIPKELPVTVIAPTLVKKIFTGSGGAKKHHMHEQFLELKEKGRIIISENEKITEHVVDSVAVGWSYLFFEDAKKVLKKDKPKTVKRDRKKKK